MSTILAPQAWSDPASALRLMRNGDQPAFPTGYRIAATLNHAFVFHRKLFMLKGLNINALSAGQSGTITTWRSYVHTGLASATSGDFQLIFDLILAPADNVLAVDPYCYWEITPVGGGAVNSDEIHYSRVETGAIDPEQLFKARIEYDAAADTAYELAFKVADYLRPVSCTVSERHTLVLDDTDTGVTPQIPFGNPDITDQQHVDMLANAHNLWKTNAAPLFAWCTDDDPDNSGDAPAITSTSYVNWFDASVSAWGADELGWRTQGQYRNPFHTDNLVCVWAVCAKHSTTTGGDVQLHNSNGSLGTISSFGTTPEWKTTTVSLDGSTDTDKVDPLGKADAGETLTIYASNLYPYIA